MDSLRHGCAARFELGRLKIESLSATTRRADEHHESHDRSILQESSARWVPVQVERPDPGASLGTSLAVRRDSRDF